MCRFGLCIIGRKNAFAVLALEPLSVVCWGLITPVNISNTRKINRNVHEKWWRNFTGKTPLG